MRKITKAMKIWMVLLIAMLTFGITGCSKDNKGETTKESPAVAPTEASEQVDPTEEVATKPTKDREGNDIILPDTMDRIVSMAPATTEVLTVLGLGDKIIATDTYSVGIEGLPADIPQFDMMTPDIEKLIALNPNIVFVTGMSKAYESDPYKALSDLGVCVVYIPVSSSIEEIKNDLLFYGEATGTSDKAQGLVLQLDEAIVNITKAVGDIPEAERKTVYFEISAFPDMYSFGNGVFLNEMIEIAGGKNILVDQKEWVTVSEESVLAANPDVIFTNVTYVEDAVGDILKRPGWDVVSAVRDKQVFLLDTNNTSHPNHNIIRGLEEMAHGLYPEKFSGQ